MTLFIISLALSPALFFTYTYYKKDHIEPEPFKRIIQVYFLGWVMAFFVSFANVTAFSRYGILATTTIFGPIFEESVKFLGVYYFIFKRDDFNEPMDGIIYSATIALGFASLENIHYLFKNYNNFVYVAILRAFLSVPGHAIFSICWGYGLANYKFKQDSKKIELFGYLLLGIVLHGIFNLIPSIKIFGNLSLFFLILYFYIVLRAVRNKFIKKAQIWSKKFSQNAQ